MNMNALLNKYLRQEL